MVELVVVNPLEPGGSSKTWMWASLNIFHVSSARTPSFRPLLLAAWLYTTIV